jgi:GNAT superfamily N-acetyltransferase
VKIINAFWEKENIGLQTTEIIFAGGEDLNEFIREKNHNEHVVLKIPSHQLDIIHYCESIGYSFIEQQFELSKRLKKKDFPRTVEIIANDYRYEEVTTDENLQIILDEIDYGIFDTDRIYLDPLLGPKYSSKRYKNWLRTMYADLQNKIYLIKDTDDNNYIGFYCINISDPHVCKGILGSVFHEYKNSGIGVLFIYFAVKYATEQGFRRYATAVSSHNIAVMNLYQLLSFQINSSYVVLRRIKTEQVQ